MTIEILLKTLNNFGMKKYLWISLFLLMVGMVSCSSDGDESVSIVGHWRLTAMNNVVIDKETGEIIQEEDYKADANTNYTLILFEDGTCKLWDYSGDHVYHYVGNNLDVRRASSSSGSWRSFTVKELTRNRLVLWERFTPSDYNGKIVEATYNFER